MINGTIYDVTTLSDTLVMTVANSQVNQMLSGVLVDFNPTLVEIQSLDSNGNTVNSYVLVPSATATIVTSLDRAQVHVGTIMRLGDDFRNRITNVVEDFSQNISIEAATLSVNGNTTNLSVTLKNNGDISFRIYGLTLQGQFNSPLNAIAAPPMNNQDHGPPGNFNTTTIPFQINSTSLVPLLGNGQQMQPMNPQGTAGNPTFGNGGRAMGFPDMFNGSMPSGQFQMGNRSEIQTGQPFKPMNPQNGTFGGFSGFSHGGQQMNSQGGPSDYRDGNLVSSYLLLESGQTVTVTFSGVIAIQGPSTAAITPIAGNSYTIQLMGEGFQSYSIVATA